MKYTEVYISFGASESELWSRKPRDSPLALRSSGEVPQLQLPSALLCSLWNSPLKCSGFITTKRVSEGLYIGQVWTDEADTGLNARLCRTVLESQQFGMTITKEVLEAADLYSLNLQHTRDESTQRLFLQAQLTLPIVDFSIVQIFPLKLVSSHLVMQLTREPPSAFKRGYLTLDQSGRALPLEVNDSMAQSYPLVGVWVAGVSDLQTPAVWTACTHFLAFTGEYEKVSPDPRACVFLLLHMASKSTFYEVSANEPKWRALSTSVEVPREGTDYFPDTTLNFSLAPELSFEDDLRMNSSYCSKPPNFEELYGQKLLDSDFYEKDSSYVQPYCAQPTYFEASYAQPSYPQSSYVQPSYAQPSYYEQSYVQESCSKQSFEQQPAPFFNKTSFDQRSYGKQSFDKQSYDSLGSSKKSYSPSAEYIIQEQSRMLTELQQQIKQLQDHVFKSQRTKSKTNDAFTNTTLHEFSQYIDAGVQDSFGHEITLKKDLFSKPEVARKSSKRYQEDSRPPLETQQPEYNPLRYSGASPLMKVSHEPNYNSRPQAMNSRPPELLKHQPTGNPENTFYVPKIEYKDSDSSGEDDEGQIKLLELKYLKSANSKS